ncbi:MAG: restriction endonuclease [Ruminococcaceae bacterium]|nr:restriction endonuclease [Oscillospiraceae bacterium]
MLTQQSIIDFCNQYDYDIRKTGNGRWIDQKLTVDVLCFIADSILEFVGDDIHKEFNVKDIWTYQPVGDNVRLIFKKPDVNDPKAAREYDKFFGQPLKLLGYSKVLHEEKRGNCNIYRINNLDILEYIAAREKNTLFFLKTYIEKVLNDSDMMVFFDEFFDIQNEEAYKKVKANMQGFLIDNTHINGKTECNRIFTKVINVLAYYKNACGTRGGHISKSIITYDELMYNRMNFRDIYSDKPKGVTRKEYAATHPVEVNEAYYHYQSAKAKKYLRLFNDQSRNGQTEHFEETHMHDKAIHIHHIFPEAMYPEICYYLENIIALTPTQHLNYAHPNGRTQEIDEQYQHLLLLSKADRIQENLTAATVEKIYEFSNFLFVLNVGFDNDDILEITDMDFCSVVNAINMHYAA